MSVTKLSGLFLFYFFSFSVLFFKSRARSVGEHHSSFLLSNLPRLNASTNIRCSLIEPVSVYYFSSFLSWKLGELTRSVEKVSNKAHASPGIGLLSCVFFTEILCRMQRFTQKKRDSMQGLHSTHQLLKC